MRPFESKLQQDSKTVIDNYNQMLAITNELHERLGYVN